MSRLAVLSSSPLSPVFFGSGSSIPLRRPYSHSSLLLGNTSFRPGRVQEGAKALSEPHGMVWDSEISRSQEEKEEDASKSLLKVDRQE